MKAKNLTAGEMKDTGCAMRNVKLFLMIFCKIIFFCTFATMIKLFQILVLVVLLFAGCTTRNHDVKLLDEACFLVDSNPDSALVLLTSMSGDALVSANNRALYNLLKTKASYKLYLSIPNDSLIVYSENYYRQIDDRVRLSEALYYRGMILYEMSDYSQAISKLLEGKELAEVLQDDSLKSKYYESLYQVNHENGSNIYALEYAKKFLNHSMLIDKQEYIARALLHLGILYSELGMRDSFDIYVQNSFPILSSSSRHDKACVLACLGSVLYEKEDYVNAEKYLLESLHLDSIPNTYVLLGDVYWEMDKNDLAESYLIKATKSSDSEVLISALRSLINLYWEQNKVDLALAAATQVIELQDSLSKTSVQEMLTDFQVKYDRQLSENRYYKLWAYAMTITLVSVMLFLTVLYSMKHYHKSIKKYVSQIDSFSRAIQEAEKKIHTLKAGNSEKDQVIADLEESSSERAAEIATLQKTIDKYRKSINERMGKGQKTYEIIASGGRMPLNDNSESCFIDFYLVKYHDVYQQWTLGYMKLTPRLLTYLILQDMGKTDHEIEEILSMSHGAFRTMKSRLNAKKQNKST